MLKRKEIEKSLTHEQRSTIPVDLLQCAEGYVDQFKVWADDNCPLNSELRKEAIRLLKIVKRFRTVAESVKNRTVNSQA